MNPKSKQFQFGDHLVTIETGEIARQADGAVIVDMSGTVILATVVGVKEQKIGQDFFPLTVNYQERSYAVGRVPGNFFRREGRPSEDETLISRLIDRPLRPLFPKGFTHEVQVIVTVISMNNDMATDIPAMIGASAALAISGLPFNGPMGCARVAYKDGAYILNPTITQTNESDLDLIVAGNEKAVLMVESEAKQLSEEIMLGAVMFGHEQMQVMIKAIREFAATSTAKPWNWTPAAEDKSLSGAVEQACEADLEKAYHVVDKLARRDRLTELRNEVVQKIARPNDAKPVTEEQVKNAFSALEKRIVRRRILAGSPRIDGRDTKTVRPLFIRTGVLPRTHGSALFTRGETQALVVTTLGTERDAQTIDALHGESKDRFMLHYNFPPYSVGETGFVGSPKRREIGHGRLAKRSVLAVMPSAAEFPYVIRVVSEITESNGSSSMASVCGTSLSLMDAGVPIKAPVAGVAMGLIKDGSQFAVLTDIMGDEDHLGDMDFKVAGTRNGINALQMDIKIDGITREIMEIALAQAREGRLHILQKMEEVISTPRKEMSEFAPRITEFKINPDKIRDVIGKGGATIRALCEETNTTIDIDDDGTIRIASTDQTGSDEARKRIELITVDVQVGHIYEGRVAKLMDFGAFVTILPGRDGLVHISQICEERVEKVSDKLSEGDVIKVKVLEIDKQGRIRLSMKAVLAEHGETIN